MAIVKPLKLASGLIKQIVSGDTIGPATIASGSITRAAATVSGTQAITLAFKPSLLMFIGSADADATVCSDGWDDGSVAICTSTNSLTLLATLLSTATVRPTDSIYVANVGGNGHRANITATSVTTFTLTWTRLGTGLAITVKYIALY